MTPNNPFINPEPPRTSTRLPHRSARRAVSGHWEEPSIQQGLRLKPLPEPPPIYQEGLEKVFLLTCSFEGYYYHTPHSAKLLLMDYFRDKESLLENAIELSLSVFSLAETPNQITKTDFTRKCSENIHTFIDQIAQEDEDVETHGIDWIDQSWAFGQNLYYVCEDLFTRGTLIPLIGPWLRSGYYHIEVVEVTSLDARTDNQDEVLGENERLYVRLYVYDN